jgi:hypothetical protein
MPQTFGVIDLEWFVIYLIRMYGQEHKEQIRRDVQDLMLPRILTKYFPTREVEAEDPIWSHKRKGPNDEI